jgi:acid ceramidase/N-acylethanolamine-hydrolysing acid amidase
MVSGIKGNEACVIERDTNSVHAFYELNATTWFLVQTNYDRDVPDPKIDPRRGAVENRLAEQGKTGFNEKILFT